MDVWALNTRPPFYSVGALLPGYTNRALGRDQRLATCIGRPETGLRAVAECRERRVIQADLYLRCSSLTTSNWFMLILMAEVGQTFAQVSQKIHSVERIRWPASL